MNSFDEYDNDTQQVTSDTAQDSHDESVMKSVMSWIYKLRSVFLAVPVVFGAIILAIINGSNLPDQVTLCMPSFEENVMAVELMEISKATAIWVPLLITALCLAMVFCSKRLVYPWLISVFSLVLPLFIYFSSVFPG